MTDDDFPTHDDSTGAWNARERFCAEDRNCRKRQMMIFRSDDPGYPTKGGNALQSRVPCKQISRNDRSEPSTLFLFPMGRALFLVTLVS